jgi:hypothetical protein
MKKAVAWGINENYGYPEVVLLTAVGKIYYYGRRGDGYANRTTSNLSNLIGIFPTEEMAKLALTELGKLRYAHGLVISAANRLLRDARVAMHEDIIATMKKHGSTK